jgi:membrane fusion protein (multidrug efflux system)
MLRGEIRLHERPPIVLLVGFDAATVEVCLRTLPPQLDVLVADSAAEARRLLASEAVAVVATGQGLTPAAARELLAERPPGDAARQAGDALVEAGGAPIALVLAGGPDLTHFQELIDGDRLFYLAQEPPPAEDLLALLRGAAAPRRAKSAEAEVGDERETARRLVAAVAAVAAQTQPSGAARSLADAARDLVAAERSYCLLYDAAHDSLWEEGTIGSEARRESASVGLVSFVLRTGRPVRVERLAADPRFDREADDPEALGDERFTAVPITGQGAVRGDLHGVLVAVRRAEQAPFSPAETALLASLAEQVAPTFGQLLLARIEPVSEELYGAGLFRPEALEHSQRGLDSEGDLLRLDPAWMRWTYRLLTAALVAGLLFLGLARVREYASGPAVVRLGDRADVTATTDGIVSQVPVAVGQRVAAGEILVRFYNGREAADLERLDQEFEMQLINRLRDPADRSAESSLLSLRAERELARARLAEREVRAPTAGTVSDLRVRPGARIGPGQMLVSLLGQGGRPQLIALLPGQYRPMLKAGLELRLELNGYRYSYQHLEVEAIGDEVVGPNEARRYLGDPIADAVQLSGPVVPVTLRLPADTFVADGQRRRYHDGMWGTAEVKVRSEPALVALVPALKALFDDGDPTRG